MSDDDTQVEKEETLDEPITEINGLVVNGIPEELMHKPDSISGKIEILLLNQYSSKEIASVGFSAGSIRNIACKLRKKFGTPFGEDKKEEGLDDVEDTSKPRRGGTVAKTKQNKGPSMESVLSVMQFPEGNPQDIMQGMRFGMGIISWSVRFVQELSGIGIMQSKPLLELAKSMREGELLAAKHASEATAASTAGAVMGAVGPALDSLQSRQDDLARLLPQISAKSNSSSNPMGDMMINSMQPYMTQLMGKVMGGMLGVGKGGQQVPIQQRPTGTWLEEDDEVKEATPQSAPQNKGAWEEEEGD